MTAVDNTVQKKLKFKITSKGIRDESDKKSCENLVKVIVSNGPRVTGAGNKNSTTNISLKSCVPACSNKRRPEMTLDVQSRKRQKMEHSVKQQCYNILKTLMTHRVGCYFNEPVDPVKLKIPDYFSIITEPMDLGSIKMKLEGDVNYGAEEFAADIRLTFSNAMLYNPPGNCVHKFAKELDGIFNKRWRTMEAKLKSESRNVEGGNVFDKVEKNDRNSKQVIKKNCQQDAQKIGLNRVALRVNLVTKRPMSLEEKQKLKLEFLEISSRKMTENLRIVFQKFGLTDLNEERLNSYFDAAEDEALWKLKRAVKCILDARAGKVKPAKIGQSEHLVRSKAVQKAKCSSCGSLACHCRLKIASVQASSSDITSERSSKLDHCGDSDLDGEVKYPLASNCSKLCPDFDGVEVVLFEESSPHRSTPVPTAASSEGWMAFNVQMSPKKAMRAAMLKRRFADTIFRATQHSPLDHGEKSDPLRMQQERERLERQRLEEKTRFEAEIKAVEAASRMRREREREAARMALQKMEKTVEINEDQEILKYLEMMMCHDSPSDFFDGLGSEASLGAIQGSCQSGNFLERLGLYIKDDYREEDEDEILSSEEGEILS